MQKKEILECEGNLYEEMDEIRKLVSDDDNIIPYGSTTRLCEAFLTIYCC